MKKEVLLSLLISLCTFFSTSAQQADDLIGKWQFEKVVSPDTDEKKIKMFQSAVGDTKMEFRKDSTYEVQMMGQKEEGTWTIEGLVVHQKSLEGKKTEINLTRLKKDELMFSIGSGGNTSIKLLKVEKFETPPKKKLVKRTNVKVTPDQITGTWYFKDKEMSSDNETAAAELLIVSLFEDAYFKYNEDGSYEDDAMFRKVVEGKWKLEKDNTVLVVTKNENPIAYDIVKISEEEIGLVHQKFEGVITYVRTKPER
jgi:hypothetical protein